MIHAFPLYNVSICDFCEAFNTIIAKNYMKYCSDYDITSFNKTAKQVLTHCIIQACCDVALSVEQGKIIFYYNKECLKIQDDAGEIAEFVHKTIAVCAKKLPISWYCSSRPLKYYLHIIEQQQGNSFLLQISNKTKSNYTFDKALSYINKNQLTFLNDHYFTCLKTRCLLLNT